MVFGPTDADRLSGLDLMRFTASTTPVQSIRGVILRERVSRAQVLNAPSGLGMWVGVHGQVSFLFAQLTATSNPVPHVLLSPTGVTPVGTLPLASLGMAGSAPRVWFKNPGTGQVISLAP